MSRVQTTLLSDSDALEDTLRELFTELEGKPVQSAKAYEKTERESYEDYVFSLTPRGYTAPCKLTLSLPIETQGVKSEPYPTPQEAGIRDFENEDDAFRELLPTLLRTHTERFVAIQEGKVIDEDEDEIALARRLEQKHRGRFVLLRKVTQQVNHDAYFESPE